MNKPVVRLLALLFALSMTVALLPLISAETGPGEAGSESPDPEDSEHPTESAADGPDGEDIEGDEDGSNSSEDEEDSDEEGEDREGRDEDEDDHDDDEDERKVQVETSDEGVQIQLERERESSEDKIELSFETETAEFQVKFEQETRDTEEELKLQAEFLSLGEYRDSNGNGQYDAGEPLVSLWALSRSSDHPNPETDATGKVTWGTPIVSDAQAGNASGHQILIPATFDGAGEFQLVLYVFGDYAELNGSTLKPTSLKIDVVIREYPYQAADTALVLFVKTEMERELEVDHSHDDLDDDEQGVAASTVSNGTEISLVFAWKEFADVDGTQRSVNSTSIRLVEEVEDDEWERKETFALSYARGTNITHDPEVFVSIQGIGASIVSPEMGSWLLVGTGALIAAVAVAVTLGPRLRKP